MQSFQCKKFKEIQFFFYFIFSFFSINFIIFSKLDDFKYNIKINLIKR